MHKGIHFKNRNLSNRKQYTHTQIHTCTHEQTYTYMPIYVYIFPFEEKKG